MRFKVVGHEEAKTAGNANWYLGTWDDDIRSYLIDTESNEIIFVDGMEPEDATLDRAISPLVEWLNDLAQHIEDLNDRALEQAEYIN